MVVYWRGDGSAELVGDAVVAEQGRIFQEEEMVGGGDGGGEEEMVWGRKVQERQVLVADSERTFNGKIT